MRGRFWLIAIALVLLTNAAVLAGVAWNRSGPPDAELRLTERELPIDRGLPSGEDSGVGLRLDWQRQDSLDWFGEERLRALGFDPGHAAEDGNRRKRVLPRRAHVVFEYDGPSWAALLQEKEDAVRTQRGELEAGDLPQARQERAQRDLEYAERELDRWRTAESRLVPVDVGPEPGALRARYEDRSRYLILAAEVRMWANRPEGPRGHIATVLNSRLHVPARLRAGLQSVLEGGTPAGYARRSEPPRYRVIVETGRRFAPRVAAIEPLDGAGH